MVEAEKIELHRSNFQYGTVGYEHFPDILEGRLRHSGIFSLPLERLPNLKFQSRLLAKMGIVTLPGLLDMPSDQFKRLPYLQRDRLRKNLAVFLGEYLALGPRGYLLARVFPESPRIPIPLEFEPDGNQAMAEALDTLIMAEREVMDKRFGLSSGIGMSVGQTAREVNKRKGRIRKTENRAVGNLRLPLISTNFSLYAALPEDSLGKEVFGVNFGCEINKLLAPLSMALRLLTAHDLNLSPHVIEEFPRLTLEWDNRSLTPLSLIIRMETNRFSESVYRELKQTLEALKR